jgi:ribosome-associated protein
MIGKMKIETGTKKAGAGAKKITSRKKALLAVAAGQAIKAGDPVIIKIGDLVDYTEYFVVMHGESTRQVMAIVDNVLTTIKQTGNPRDGGVEGGSDSRWVVIDWGDVIIHVFLKELRHFYELEKLWADASRVKVPGEPAPAQH